MWNFWKNKKPKVENNLDQVNEQQIESDHNLYKFKLTAYAEITYVAKILLKKGKVLIDLNGLEKTERRRILDFLSGVVFFQEGKAKKIKENIYYFSLPQTSK